ncbi:HNH endonuclease [compost metagenome]
MELPPDRVHYLDKDHVQLHVTSKKTILEKIEHLKFLISHENLNPSYDELFNLALDAAIEKVEKKKGLRAPVVKQKVRVKNDSVHDDRANLTQSFAVKKSRYISRNVKRFVIARAQNQCEHIHSDGKRCSSKFQTQFDHIIAFSKGGKATLENMQMLCRVHNSHKGSS